MAATDKSDNFVRVGPLVQVPEGEARGFDLARVRVCVARLEEHLFAFQDECPQDDCLLSDGRVDERGEIVCPCDGSRFDLETGEPAGGPAKDPVTIFPVRVEQGWIEVLVA